MNRSISKMLLGLTAIIPLSQLMGCAYHEHDHGPYRYEREVVVVEELPPPRREVIIERERPSVDYIWIDGHWVRHGDRWEWYGGRWERRPHRESIWVAGHHEHHDHGYVWIEGRWR